MSSPGSDNVLYHYEPSLAAAIITCALFGFGTLLHIYQACASRAWYMIPLLLGGICEAIGYIGRVLGASEAPDYALGPYIIQALLILVAPPLIAASVYMIMGYIISATDGDQHSIIRRKLLTTIFVVGDVTSFMIQSTGAGTLAKKEENARKAGNWIVIGGLAVQLIFFGFFIAVISVFWIRMRRNPTAQSKLLTVPWSKHLFVLFSASVLIMVRSVFRLIEYVQGQNGYLLKHELYLYVFDAALMFATLLIFNIIHPTQISAVAKGGNMIHLGLWLKPAERPTSIEEKENYASDIESSGLSVQRDFTDS